MSDLISRQAAIDAFMTMTSDGDKADWCKWVLKQLPSAQPERKAGKWIKHISDIYPADSTMECNVCHAEQTLLCDDNYCPNCGAKMEDDHET